MMQANFLGATLCKTNKIIYDMGVYIKSHKINVNFWEPYYRLNLKPKRS